MKIIENENYLIGDVVLSSEDKKNNIYFLSAQQVSETKWKVSFSFERIGYTDSASAKSSYGYGYASSDVLYFLVSVGDKLKFSEQFIRELSKTEEARTLFSDKNTEIRSTCDKYRIDHIVFKIINNDSITIDTCWQMSN